MCKIFMNSSLNYNARFVLRRVIFTFVLYLFLILFLLIISHQFVIFTLVQNHFVSFLFLVTVNHTFRQHSTPTSL